MYRSVKPLEALHPLQMYLQQTSILHAQYKTVTIQHVEDCHWEEIDFSNTSHMRIPYLGSSDQ